MVQYSTVQYGTVRYGKRLTLQPNVSLGLPVKVKIQGVLNFRIRRM